MSTLLPFLRGRSLAHLLVRSTTRSTLPIWARRVSHVPDHVIFSAAAPAQFDTSIGTDANACDNADTSSTDTGSTVEVPTDLLLERVAYDHSIGNGNIPPTEEELARNAGAEAAAQAEAAEAAAAEARRNIGLRKRLRKEAKSIFARQTFLSQLLEDRKRRAREKADKIAAEGAAKQAAERNARLQPHSEVVGINEVSDGETTGLDFAAAGSNRTKTRSQQSNAVSQRQAVKCVPPRHTPQIQENSGSKQHRPKIQQIKSHVEKSRESRGDENDETGQNEAKIPPTNAPRGRRRRQAHSPVDTRVDPSVVDKEMTKHGFTYKPLTATHMPNWFEKGVVPDREKVHSLVRGLNERGAYGSACYMIMGEMPRHGLDPDEETMKALATAYLGTKQLQARVASINASSIVAKLVNRGFVEQADYLVTSEFPSKGVVPDRETFDSLLRGLKKSGAQVRIREVVVQEMPKLGLDPDHELLSDLFRKCNSFEALESAYFAAELLTETDVRIDAKEIVAAIAKQGFVDEADGLVTSQFLAKGVVPDHGTVNLLLEELNKIAAHARTCEIILHEMPKFGLEPNGNTIEALVAAYLATGQQKEARQALKVWREMTGSK